MDAATILIFGAALLGCGSLSLFLVRFSNRHLKGLGWVAAAFAVGAAGAAALLANRLPHGLQALVPDMLTLLPFVLLQVAACELLGRPLLPRWGLLLLSAMAAVDLLNSAHHLSGTARISFISLFVALQCGETAMRLWRQARERKPAQFCAVLLMAFGGFNLLRAALVSSGLAHRWHIDGPLMTLCFILFIAVGLGLAFGFFWMTQAWFAMDLEEVAGTDPLTRVCNRRTFLRACEKEMRSSARKDRPFSVLMADLDHFKSINDRFGHEAGDEALIAAVESMQNAIRGIDVLGRWGGEEFVVLLPNATEAAAVIVAERMRANVERLELQLAPGARAGEGLVRMTISIGLATFRASEDLGTLLRRADRCLYMAKGAGRNRVLQAAS